MKKLADAAAVLAISILLCAGQAFAREGNGPPPGTKPGSDHSGHGNGGCVSACVHEARDCRAGVRDARRACVKDCAPLRDAVKAACPDDDGNAGQGQDDESDDNGVTPECTAARDALRGCLDPCRSTYRTKVRECHTTGHECLQTECAQ
jgi:hypothetical protein